MRKALDLSNYTTSVPVPGGPSYYRSGGYITDQLVQCWLGEGFDHAIVGTQWPHVARHQLEVCGRNGMSLDAYHWIWYDADYIEAIQRSLDTVSGLPIGRLWVDIEDTVTRKPASELIRISHEVLDYASRQPYDLGIYTARWYWPNHLGETHEFSHYPLWHAEYLQPQEGKWPTSEPNFNNFRPYGGWTRPLMWQYAGSVQLCGANMDLNLLDTVAPQPIVLEEEELVNPSWGEWRDRPDTVPYRSYLLFATRTGLWKLHVGTAEDHNALLASGVAGPGPVPMALEELNSFGGGPAPDEA